VYTAVQKGFFKDSGIDAQLTDVNSGTLASSALSSGSVDIACIDSTIAGPLLDGGMKLNVLSGINIMSWHLLSTPDATPADTTYPASMQALKGKKVAVTAIGSGSYFALLALLAGAGMSKSDVTIVPTGSLPAFDTAIKTGQVQAGLADHGTFVRLTISGVKVTNLVDMTKPAPGFPPSLAAVSGVPSTSYWAKADWVSTHPEVVKGFQKAVARAVVWLTDPANKADVLKLLQDYGLPTGLDPEQYVSGILPILASYFPVDGLNAQQEYNVTNGIQKQSHDAATLVAAGTPQTADEMKSLASS
jgi:NitT/TauT family transport system substrate-binding protein